MRGFRQVNTSAHRAERGNKGEMRAAESSLHTIGGLVSHRLFSWSASAADRNIRTRRATPRVCAAPLVFLAVLAVSAMAHAQETDSLIELSLEELLNVEVTSVSKKAEKRTEAPAAIYVLTHEDIRRSGARNIPDALRLVPGVNVAQLSSSTWSVTARGFGGRFANKLLVLIDGRSIYTPLFSGVYWEAHEVMLEDIDRIEVIRGPGGALWGANAVNGVINIVTKKAEDTQGGLLTVGGGTEEQGFGAFRYGGKLKEKGHYRIYGKYFNRDNGGDTSLGTKANDGWDAGQGGFRIDWDASDRDLLTVQGDFMNMDQNQTFDLAFLTAPFARRVDSQANYDGQNVLGRWTRTFSEDSDLQVQLYYDRYHRRDVTLSETRNTIDLDAQQTFTAGERNEIVWGLGFRYTHDDIGGSPFIFFTPDSRGNNLFSAFIQDTISLTDELRLTLGTKIEHNSFSGFEYQPSVRLAWTPNEKHTLWSSVSRAVRTPSRAEQDVHIVNTVVGASLLVPGPTAFVLQGTHDFDSEELIAYEVGYRISPTDRVAIDIATFWNDYDNLRSLELGTPFVATNPLPAHTAVPFFARNNSEGRIYGIELALDWKAFSWWQVHASYTFQEVNLKVPPGDPVSNAFAGNAPEHQAVLQSRFDLPHNVELDATLRYVDTLPSLAVDDYIEFDLRLGWQPREDLEFALVGRNLLHDDHFEFAPTFVSQTPTGVQRSVYGQVTWKF